MRQGCESEEERQKETGGEGGRGKGRCTCLETEEYLSKFVVKRVITCEKVTCSIFFPPFYVGGEGGGGGREKGWRERGMVGRLI